MTKHSKSFLLSLFIHLLLFAGVVYTYDEIATALHKHKVHSEEKRVCIQLGRLQASSTSVQKSKKEESKQVISTTQAVKKNNVLKKTSKPLPKQMVKKPHKVKKQSINEKKPVKDLSITKEKSTKKETIVTQKSNQAQEAPKKLVQRADKAGMPMEDCPMACCNTKASAEQHYKDENLAKIAQLLQDNLYYPRRARKRGIEGEVKISFTIHTDAKLSDIKVIASSNDILSRAAIKTLENLSGKFPKPVETLTLTVPIAYYLSR
jgi:protein TonB